MWKVSVHFRVVKRWCPQLVGLWPAKIRLDTFIKSLLYLAKITVTINISHLYWIQLAIMIHTKPPLTCVMKDQWRFCLIVCLHMPQQPDHDILQNSARFALLRQEDSPSSFTASSVFYSWVRWTLSFFTALFGLLCRHVWAFGISKNITSVIL